MFPFSGLLVSYVVGAAEGAVLPGHPAKPCLQTEYQDLFLYHPPTLNLPKWKQPWFQNPPTVVYNRYSLEWGKMV